MSSAELVYASKLRLPADLTSADESVRNDSDPISFARKIKQQIEGMKPTLSRPVKAESSIPDDLNTCTHVLTTNKTVLTPLQRPKQGPFSILKRNKHTFTLQTENGPKDVNIQHLTPVKVDRKTVTFNLPRRVGRPRKQPAPVTVQAAPARPRGRPRKKPASD